MDHGPNGHPGVVVSQTAEETGLENATTPCQCLVEPIVLEMHQKNPHFFAMEMIAVQVKECQFIFIFLSKVYVRHI